MRVLEEYMRRQGVHITIEPRLVKGTGPSAGFKFHASISSRYRAEGCASILEALEALDEQIASEAGALLRAQGDDD